MATWDNDETNDRKLASDRKSGHSSEEESNNLDDGYDTDSRLPISAGVFRIPVFSVPVAFFYRNHDSCSAVTLSEPPQESCLCGIYVGTDIGIKK